MGLSRVRRTEGWSIRPALGDPLYQLWRCLHAVWPALGLLARRMIGIFMMAWLPLRPATVRRKGRVRSGLEAAALGAALVVALSAQPAWAAERIGGVPVGEEVNTGQDPTRPVTRVDVRFKYQESDHRAVDGDSVQVLTLRADWTVPLRGGWIIALRGDLPLSWDDTPSLDNPRGVRQFGLSDVLLQGLLITPTVGNWTAALGTQVIFPTAARAQMGTGKFQLVPSGAVKYDMGGWIPGAWTALLVRHAVDVGEAQAGRPSVNQTIVQPFLNFDLPREWFLTFSPEMRYDWQSANWHIPFNVEVGTMVTRRIVMSIEYNVAIEKNLPLYKQAVEFKVGYFF